MTDKTLAACTAVLIIHMWLIVIAAVVAVAFGPLWALLIAIPFLGLILGTKP